VKRKILSRIGIAGGILTLASLGFIAAPASGAFAATVCPSSGTTAAGQSGSNSGDCPVTGTITIGTVFAIADDFSTFTVGLNGAPSPATYAGDILVEANAASQGYSVTEVLAGGAFTFGANSISGTNVEAGTYEPTAGNYQTTPTYAALIRGTDQNFFASQIPGNAPNGTGFTGVTGTTNENCQTPVAGDDCYGVPSYYLSGSQSYPPGTYSGVVDFDLWVN
jgi:hypothetical protein